MWEYLYHADLVLGCCFAVSDAFFNYSYMYVLVVCSFLGWTSSCDLCWIFSSRQRISTWHPSFWILSLKASGIASGRSKSELVSSNQPRESGLPARREWCAGFSLITSDVLAKWNSWLDSINIHWSILDPTSKKGYSVVVETWAFYFAQFWDYFEVGLRTSLDNIRVCPYWDVTNTYHHSNVVPPPLVRALRPMYLIIFCLTCISVNSRTM